LPLVGAARRAVLGESRLQPIAVGIAEGRAALTSRAANETYGCGPEAYAFVELDQIGGALRRDPKVHVPLGPVKLLTGALQWLPLSADPHQIVMLEEENITDPASTPTSHHAEPFQVAPAPSGRVMTDRRFARISS
jgi:hypothetical protein